MSTPTFDDLKKTVEKKIEDAKNNQQELEKLLDDIKEMEKQVKDQAKMMTLG